MSNPLSILNVFPPSNREGVPLGQQITVLFDKEADLTTINDGTFVLIGPDRSTVFSPVDLTPFDAPTDNKDILSSPYVEGYVKGTLSFAKADEEGNIIEDDISDLDGSGNQWCTLAIFTPSVPLEPNKGYTFTVLGDETPEDKFDSGVSNRTVFDTVEEKIGTGKIIFDGGYTGTSEKQFFVEITKEGIVGVAEYIWWDSIDPLDIKSGITVTGKRTLKQGVFITCDNDGYFNEGDTFSVVVKKHVRLQNNYRWDFITGNGSIVVPTSSASASGIEELNIPRGLSTGTFRVISTSPVPGKYGVSIIDDIYIGNQIIIEFSNSIDSLSLIDNIFIKIEPANGDPRFGEEKELEYAGSILGNKLTIAITPEQLYLNGIITVVLNKDVSDTENVSLGEDFDFFFSTKYSPLYTSIRRIQLDIGPFLKEVPEETIMLSILEASLQADALSFVHPNSNHAYFEYVRSQYVACLAELILLRAMSGTSSLSDRMSKTLGDLKVSRGGLGFKEKLEKLEDCVEYWRIPLSSGGEISSNASLLPQFAVKGRQAEDAIAVHRQWQPTSRIGMPAANDNFSYFSERRRLRTFRKR